MSNMDGDSADTEPTMTGRVIIVTGANSGIGFEAAKYLCDGGNEVILACRNEEKGKAAVGKILKANPNALASFMQLDLAELSSVRQFAEEFHQSGRKLHGLVNNAGIYLWAKDTKRHFTKDNFELAMGTNHLGHFLLTNLLLDDLKKTGSDTGDSRIVVVSSMLHDGNFRNKNLPGLDIEDLFIGAAGKYSANLAYKNSKLANLLFTYELTKKLDGTGVTVNALCPGFIPSTDLGRHASAPMRFFTRYVLDGILRFTKVTRSTAQGAKAIVELATSEKLKGVSGKFYRDHAEAESSAESKNEELAQKLWEVSGRYCHMEGYEPLDAPAPPVEEPAAAATPAKNKEKEEEKKEEAEVKPEGEGQVEIKVEGEGQAEAAAEVAVTAVEEVKEEKKDEEKKEEKEEEKKEEGTSKATTEEEVVNVIEAEPETKGKDLDVDVDVEKKVETIVASDTAVAAQ
ncbi:retinol dehydrogenase 13-like isoform X1 [Haliotis cracherodii]|uniref:retinol dehydrogenase 13-like isoform X1 n=2 Tax=Haliotis cracherodii TaxID=6455 RepID=UPI0039E9C13A